MQEPLSGRTAPVSALLPAGECKEITMNGAKPGIVVGLVSQT
jgi:hypothetical protein